MKYFLVGVAVFYILLQTIDTAETAEAVHWGYNNDNGPSTWPGTCQTGTRQSPINIDFSAVQVDPSLPPIQFRNYEHSGRATFDNNGHTEIAENFVSSVTIPYIEGGGLNYRYVFSQLHFHWSDRDDSGSEHTIGYLRYPLEVHFVHLREGLSQAQALVTPNGIAVVAVFFRICPVSDALKTLANVFSITRPVGSNVTITYRPSELLPTSRDSYFRYQGSLTTPPCNEVVIWSVMADPICVHRQEIEELRNHYSDNTHLLKRNYRPLQATNDRVILFRPKNNGIPQQQQNINQENINPQNINQQLQQQQQTMDDWKRQMELWRWWTWRNGRQK